jgi:hypothetical protein
MLFKLPHCDAVRTCRRRLMHFGMLRSMDGQRFTSVSQSSFDSLGPNHWGRKLLRNVGNYLPTDTYIALSLKNSSQSLRNMHLCSDVHGHINIADDVALSENLRPRGRTDTLIYSYIFFNVIR